jgi:hypothetical protein
MSKRCSAKNRNGKRCGAWAVTEGDKCALHLNPELAAKMGSKHGRTVKFRSRPDVLALPHRPLKSIEEVCEFLEEMYQVWCAGYNSSFSGLIYTLRTSAN